MTPNYIKGIYKKYFNLFNITTKLTIKLKSFLNIMLDLFNIVKCIQESLLGDNRFTVVL